MVRKYIAKIANIKDGADIEKTKDEIDENITLRGYNIWILICSAILASIGLDTNSVAVIIGAMLISPLMSPILGIGLSLGIHDNEMFRHSIMNLFIATVLCLAASTTYFSISPFAIPTAEIISRTKPTILDVGIAFFGGVAGIVSASRKDKTNAIPGVAIATALMPPLCATGFGIATGNTKVLLGAFYLFVVNAAFISLATLIIVKYLKFPIKKYIDTYKQKVYARYAIITILILILPSVYFLISVYQELQFKSAIKNLLVSKIEQGNNNVIKWDLVEYDTLKVVKFYVAGAGISDSTSTYLQKLLAEHSNEKFKLTFTKVNISKDEIAKLSADVAQGIMKGYEANATKQPVIDTIYSAVSDSILFSSIERELRILLPEMQNLIIGKNKLISRDSSEDVFFVDLQIPKKKIKEFSRIDYRKNVYNFIKYKLETDTVIFKISSI